MNTYSLIYSVYFNGANPPLQFRVSEGILLVDLKTKLNTFIRYQATQRVIKAEYRLHSINNKGKILWSTFYRYSTKNPIELGVIITR